MEARVAMTKIDQSQRVDNVCRELRAHADAFRSGTICDTAFQAAIECAIVTLRGVDESIRKGNAALSYSTTGRPCERFR